MDWAYLLRTLWLYGLMFGAIGIVCAIVSTAMGRRDD